MSDKTVEELQAELQQLRADHTAEVESLRKEASRHRVARNDALRRVHALDTVVKAHNIRFSLDEADLSGLTIKDGQVEGEYKYTLPTTPVNPPPTDDPSSTEEGLTLDKVKMMSAAEIEADWDNVQSVMAANQRRA